MRKIAAILLGAVMAVLMLPWGAVAFAEGHISSLLDYDDCLTSEEENDVRELLAKTAKAIKADFGVVITDDLGGATPRQYAENELTRLFGGDGDSILFLICNDFDSDGYDFIYCTGTAADLYQDRLSEIMDAFYKGLDYGGYYSGISSVCGYFGVVDENAEEAPAQSSGYRAALSDYDDCLTASEEERLLEYMQMTAEEIECHVGVVTSSDLGGLSDEKYTKEYYQTTFGTGSNAVVLLFCNDHVNYDYIYTYGLGTDKFDSRVDDMFDDIYDAMGDDKNNYDYYAAATKFCSYMRNHNYATDYNDYIDDEDFYIDGDSVHIDFTVVVISVIMGGIIALVIVHSVSGGYVKKKPISARHYMDASSIRWLDRQDIYLRETTTSVRVSSSSSGGGSRSRSGGGGRRRCGGGGGRGRRR